MPRERERNPMMFPAKGRTHQSFKKECDINVIMAKYRKTGLLDHVSQYAGFYGDLPDSADYQDNLNAIMAADAAFNSLTAEIRGKFDNDPAAFLDWVQNPENQDEINALGLGKVPSTVGEVASDSPPSPTPGDQPAAPESGAS